MTAKLDPSPEVRAAVRIALAVGSAIRELRECPEGPLYARVMGRLSLEQFNGLLAFLERQHLIAREPGNWVRWIGP